MEKSFLICIIDDDDISRYYMSRNLASLNLSREMLVFSDGEDAISYIENNINNSFDLPDVIFLDINMPIMDGFQFMEAYTKLKPRIDKEISIYMTSSSISPEDVQRAKAVSEISDYLVKPVEPEKLDILLQSLEVAKKCG